MKNSILFLCCAFCLFLISCDAPLQENTGNFVLLPSPQQFEIEGASQLMYKDIATFYSEQNTDLSITGELLKGMKQTENSSKAQVIFEIDTTITTKAEGYQLNVASKQIIITAKDEAGLLYAFMTLEQLLEDAKEQNVPLPICQIKDYPELAYRAIHLDLKHHLETKEYYYQLLDRLAKFKINGIIVELEDKLKYERQPVVASADAWSITEWKAFSDYAFERNIEISPLVQGLGHASFILKHDEYKDLRDDPDSDWAFNPLDSTTYEVQFDLYRDAMEAHPHGKYLHVGGDEVHTTGRESGKASLELQLMWLNKVSKFAADHGRIPIFWDDMPLKHAGVYRSMFDQNLSQEEVSQLWEEKEPALLEFLDQFPKNCIYMRWNYETPETPGNRKAMSWFTDNGLQVMGATAGQTRWTLMPQNESNIEPIKAFADLSIEKGINGLLLTLWDDDSPHFELYMRGISAFAEYTWAGEKRSKEDLKSAYRHRMFSSQLEDPAYAFIDELETSVAFWKNAFLNKNQRNYLKTMDDPKTAAVIGLPNKAEKGSWSKQYAERLAQAADLVERSDRVAIKIAEMQALAIRHPYILEVYGQVNKMAGFAPNTLLALKEYDEAKDEVAEQTALQKIQQIPAAFKTLRAELEEVYAQTRLLNKPADYILDQDHHVHLANQTRSFDWQFYAEMLFMEKMESWWEK